MLDIGTDPLAPKVVGTLALDNTIAGPPTNLAITADERWRWSPTRSTWWKNGVRKQVPDNRLFVIDLSATPPKLIDTLAIGRQPGAVDQQAPARWRWWPTSADNSVSVLRIAGQKVTLIDTVVVGESVAHVRFTPDGRRALAAKFPSHKIALLDVDGEKVSYNKVDLAAGLWPYNVDVTPDGKLALTADNGNSGASDGQVDTGERDRPRSHAAARDRQGGGRRRPRRPGGEPDRQAGRGRDPARQQFVEERVLLQPQRLGGGAQDRRQEGHAQQRGRGARPARGAVFSADGKYLYVGNFIDQDVSILRVEGDMLVDTGKWPSAWPGTRRRCAGVVTH